MLYLFYAESLIVDFKSYIRYYILLSIV